MDIRQLRYFIEVANTRNLTRAAQNLYISQPTLSIAMKKLEEKLDTQLFNSNYELTEAGRFLYDRGSEIVSQFDDMLVKMDQFKEMDNQRETIRIGMSILFAVQYMEEISNFIANNLHVDLLITQNGSRKIQDMLVDEELDIALVSLPNTQSEHLDIQTLSGDKAGYHVCVVMPDTNPLADRESVTFEDIRNQRFSSLNDNFMLGKVFKERMKHFGYDANIVLEHEDLQVLVYSIQELDSVSILPKEYQAITDIQGLKWVPLEDRYNFFPIGIATRKQQVKSQSLQNLIKELSKNS